MLSLKKYRYLLIKKTSASEQEMPQSQTAPLLSILEILNMRVWIGGRGLVFTIH